MKVGITCLLFFLNFFDGVSCAAIAFTRGYMYSANYFERTIIGYDDTGREVSSFAVPSGMADEIRGIAFGPDGLLYATAIRGSGFAVLSFDETGNLRETYEMPNVYAKGNISYGKLAVDGRNIFVAGAGEVTKFEIGLPFSGVSIYQNNQLFDVEVLPSGNILAVSAYYLDEINLSGTVVRHFSSAGGDTFTDLRGVEFDPDTNRIFITELGHSGSFFRLMRLNGDTGALEKNITLHYADDMFLTDGGDLLVGSRTLPARLLTRDLEEILTLGESSRMFVTQFSAPEPSIAMMVFFAVSLFRIRRPANLVPRL